jgi:hypothetical protein
MEPTQMRVTTIRFGRTAWERIQQAAHDEGVSASQYVREAALMRAFMQDYRAGTERDVTAGGDRAGDRCGSAAKPVAPREVQ